ncbi:serine hydrolase [Nocardia camponoti]|uniref:Serine hydrolase n=1 Tax=Nocardia camponoti TaxID=1616106 RepID=A0A917QFX7_9NOCA|nr:serine hydrolase [Nocardia camponoti]
MSVEFGEGLAARVAAVRHDARVPSMTVAVAEADTLLGQASAGYADVENSIAATPEVPYRIGSITKTFTAATVLILAEEGAVRLVDTVDRFIPGTPFGDVTIASLLSHSSGLQREAPLDMWETMQGPNSAGLRSAFVDVELIARLGERWHYSNLGYAVLGQIIETVTAQPFESVIEHRLLTPLKLGRTTWSAPSDAAVGYRLDPHGGGVHREPVMDQGAIGAGGQLWSTAGDLLVWGAALLGANSNVLSHSVIDQMHTLQVMVDPHEWTRGWGLGLILERCDERILAGHTGSMPGFQSALQLDRVNQLVVVALANATRGVDLCGFATSVLLDIPVEDPMLLDGGYPLPCPPEVQAILGSWWSESDETIFGWGGNALHAHLASDPGRTSTTFVALGNGRYRADIGRLRGEVLVISESAQGVEVHWATYPFTRVPR